MCNLHVILLFLIIIIIQFEVLSVDNTILMHTFPGLLLEVLQILFGSLKKESRLWLGGTLILHIDEFPSDLGGET